MTDQTLCDKVRAILPEYALGTLDAATEKRVAAALQRCPELLPELEQYQALGDGLLYAAPDVQPAASLKTRILESARSTPAAQPASLSATSPRRQRFGWGLVAAALLMLLVISNGVWFALYNRTRPAPLSDVPVPVASGAVQRVELTAGGTDSGALSWVSIEENVSWVAWFTANGLPASAPDDTYLLWLQRAGEPPLKIGQFRVESADQVVLVFEIFTPIGSFDEVFVTAEANPTVPLPTGERLLTTPIDL